MTDARQINYTSCPFSNTHSRLEQAHRLWHQALDAYDDPEGFRANLNALVEALRNVTFMLQNEKSAIPAFNTWYERWRELMKRDEVMKWLVEARTTVVHKSDLSTRSRAHVTIHTNVDLATTEIEVSPLLSTPMVTNLVLAELPEPFASNRKTLVLSLERRWGVEALGDQELLDALAHGYGVLSELLRDAHEQVGFDHDAKELHVSEPVQMTNDGRMPCMITTVEQRTRRMSLENETWLVPQKLSRTIDPNDAARIARRYGTSEVEKRRRAPVDPIEMAESVLLQAKRMLAKDKAHVRIMLLRTHLGWRIHQLDARDRPEKYSLMRVMADEIRRTQSDAIVEVGEIWVSSVDEFVAGRMPEVARDRREALVVRVATKSGLFREYITPFRRGLLGRIKFAETTVDDDLVPYYLAPIFDVWDLPQPDNMREPR